MNFNWIVNLFGPGVVARLSQLPEGFHRIQRIRASQAIALDVAVADLRIGAMGLGASLSLATGTFCSKRSW